MKDPANWAEEVFVTVADEVWRGLEAQKRGEAVDILQPSLDFADRNIADITAAVNDSARRSGTAGIACCAGCSTCCYIRVSALPVEVFNVARYVNENFSPADRSGLLERLKEYVSAVEAQPREVRMRFLYACPALGSDGRCTVYHARPLVCRIHHSRNLRICASLTEPTPVIPAYADATAPVLQGVQEGARRAGTVPNEVEYVPALITALEQSDAEMRWLAGEDVFEDNPVLFLADYKAEQARAESPTG